METDLLARGRSYRLVDGLGVRMLGLGGKKWAVQGREHASYQGHLSLSLPGRVQFCPPNLEGFG